MFPSLLRKHRLAMSWSQERLGAEARVSARHLSCLETGRATPSREMVVRLGRVLQLELRDRNALLVAAGFAALYPQSSLLSPAMMPWARAIDYVLNKQEPFPAFVLDAAWNVLRTNEGAAKLLAHLLKTEPVDSPSPFNLVRATLHPDGLRPYIVNWAEIASLLLERLKLECRNLAFTDPRHAMLEEVSGYPDVAGLAAENTPIAPSAVVRLRTDQGELQLFSLLSRIGTPLDVTSQELTIETLFPVDDLTAQWFATTTVAAPESRA